MDNLDEEADVEAGDEIKSLAIKVHILLRKCFYDTSLYPP
jgi:hypothetical protein